jgi:hypothetical protein
MGCHFKMAMNEPTAKSGLTQSIVGTLFVFGRMGAMLFVAGRKDHPGLHTILGAGLFLRSRAMALLLRGMGGHIYNPLPGRLTVAFTLHSQYQSLQTTSTPS